MPGKKDPEYFPLNLNMSSIGGFFGDDDMSPLNGSPHHGKFEYGSGSPPLNMSFNVSIPPANSEEDDTDDESSSVTGSDIDVDMDTLVYSIREKLKMSPKFSSNPSTKYWETESPPNEPHQCVVNPSVVSGVSNNSNNSSNNSSSSRRCRSHPYSQWRHSIHSHHNHHHNNHHSSHANYHHRHILNGGIQKQHHKSNFHNHWWTSKSFNDISSRVNSKKNPGEVPPTDAYSLLQELIESGSLIKEAVRRIKLKQKRFTSLNANNTNSSSNSLTKKFTCRDQDTENSYPPMPMSAP